MKIYDEKTHEEISNPDLELGYVYDGTIVTGREEEKYEVMEGTVTDSNPDGLRRLIPAHDIVEECQYYHAYTDDEIEEERGRKITELSDACNLLITKGAEVQLSNKEKKNFSYSIEDQSNISEMFNAVIMGATSYPYHANGETCMMYSAADIVLIYTTLSSLKTAQTTYYNQLRQYIYTLNKFKDIESVTYGQELTGEYLETYTELISNAKIEMDKVLEKVTQNVS